MPYNYGWYAWSRQTHNHHPVLHIRWLSLPKALVWAAVATSCIALIAVNIDRVFAGLTQIAVAMMQVQGISVQIPALQPDAFPFWDSAMTVCSIVAMIIMTRKYVENWLLWAMGSDRRDQRSYFRLSGRLRDGAGIHHPVTLIALNSSWLWIKSARQNDSCPLSSAQ